MARYIFVTGGVVSSLGKGLSSASLAYLLQSRGYKVRIRKLDPYLNVDPGTMSPFQHGEVFVTDDGAETDLDLGHYERFSGISAKKSDNITTGKISNQVRYFKAKVLETHKADDINTTMAESINDKTIVFTDKSTSYVDIADYVELHITEKSSKDTTKETLKWVHIFISNAKRNLLGNYHKIKGKYLQLYLNEFVYKLNRRYFGEQLFDRVVVTAITGA